MRPRLTYHAGDGWLHRLHPLTKVGWLIFVTVFVFAVQNPWAVLGVLLALGATFALTRLPLFRLPGARMLLLTAGTLALLQLLFVDTGAALFTVGPVTVTVEGAHAALYVAGRFVSVVLLSYLFVLTTDPNDLAYALMQIGLPYRYGFTLITALRLVPIFEAEGQTVYEAQLARGLRYDVGGPGRYLRLARQFFLPLLVSALGKVDALAVSMEGRCFGKYPRRTFLRKVTLHRRDYVALALLAVSVLVLIKLKVAS